MSYHGAYAVRQPFQGLQALIAINSSHKSTYLYRLEIVHILLNTHFEAQH